MGFQYWLLCALCIFSFSGLVEPRQHGHSNRQGGQASGRGHPFAGKNIFSLIIRTDPKMARIMGRDFHKVPQGVDGTPANNANKRLEHSNEMIAQLPFPVEPFYSVYTQNCPSRKTKGNDRGVMMAHYQIWQAWDYQTRQYHMSGNSTAGANDVLIIFEDDANIAVNNVTLSLYKEINTMNVDLIFLGWCYGNKKGQLPMCLHAYAMTRKGVRAISSRWDVCSNDAIDGQLKHLANEPGPLFTWKKADDSSFKSDLKNGYEDNPQYFTRGIFVQKNGLVSFNHHGFQNNAG